MKTCPVCHTQMEDSQNLCPSCGADYIAAIVDEISSESQADAELLLANLEQGLAPLEQAPLPTMGETARRLMPALCGVALVFCLIAGAATRANIFYLLAVAVLLPLVPSLVALVRHRRPMGRGEVLVHATARIFAEDADNTRRKAAGTADADARLDAMQRRIDQAKELQRQGHARNARKIWMIVAAVVLLAGVGVGVLAARNHAARKAEAEYASLPEWIKLRDSYLATVGNDDQGQPEARSAIVGAMLDAAEAAEAEEFFFAHCQGHVGDLECAQLIARHYLARGERQELETFTSKVSLRYPSDTKKIRAIK